MIDHAEFVRTSVRQRFAEQTRSYAEAAFRHAAHAKLLVANVRPRAGERVLDVATGPGGVALVAARAVGASGQVLATDLVPEFAAVVAERCQAAGLTNVSFRAMGAEALDLPDASFDVVLCGFGLMFVPDPVRALGEMRRVLRSGGRLGLTVWSTQDRVTHHDIARRALARFTPPVPPGQRLPGPLDLGAPGLIEQHVAAAGFQSIVVERHTRDCVYRSPEEYWRQHFESVRSDVFVALQDLAVEQREQLYRDTLAEVEGYRRGDRIYLPSEAVYATALR
jgi:ubiquinone/menaquinone biosynthesis C-methylase UbiE